MKKATVKKVAVGALVAGIAFAAWWKFLRAQKDKLGNSWTLRDGTAYRNGEATSMTGAKDLRIMNGLATVTSISSSKVYQYTGSKWELAK